MAAGAGAALGSALFPEIVRGASATRGAPKRVIFFLQNQGFDPLTAIPAGLKESCSLLFASDNQLGDASKANQRDKSTNVKHGGDYITIGRGDVDDGVEPGEGSAYLPRRPLSSCVHFRRLAGWASATATASRSRSVWRCTTSESPGRAPISST